MDRRVSVSAYQDSVLNIFGLEFEAQLESSKDVFWPWKRNVGFF